ncbi:hypothetical protein SAMN04488011_10628 [Palleronia pelagia]|uniref:Uncharacterized protein n=2 Tax=Palleronia pelagia TaxID=387096 RepID=A0A1H8J1L3_9RHOB|nr:hypothetical protein SAMN04488011_10628 [Palleronia pelagia]
MEHSPPRCMALGLLTVRRHILGLSRLTCRLTFGVNESWCARGWRLRKRYRFWAGWVRVFGARHCEKSWRHYYG